MTTTEHIESFKANFQSSAKSIRRGLSGFNHNQLKRRNENSGEIYG